ncbi:20 kDa protein having G-X-X-X-Q-X-W motif-containing protein [Flagelloscypha sp. PMI_526]|nr:20 kDa protein having G-X-X-X-Q-X-W motif-containing protein [Flagelloscypha sp. PMI_526]
MLAITLLAAAFSAIVASATPLNARAGATLRPTRVTQDKCVDIAGANFADGTAVQIHDCNGTEAQSFTYPNGGTGAIKLASHPEFCLDAGENPTNGSKVHLWTCYDGLSQQTWYHHYLGTLRLDNSELCLDLTDGNTANGNQLQVYHCSGGTFDKDGQILGNSNQVWFT